MSSAIYNGNCAMFFKNFFKPKWQHSNAQVRKQALLALDATTPEAVVIFSQLAKHDTDPVLRQLAVRKLTDVDVVRDIVATDKDATVREFALQRYRRLLAGLDPGYAAELCVKKLPELTDKDIEFIVRQSADSGLRAAAMAYVKREALFGDMAIVDPDLDLRLAALSKVTQKSTLERVLKSMRTRDKRVSAEAEQRLAALNAPTQEPLRWAEKISQLCAELESLHATTEKRGDWQDASTRFERIQHDLHVLQAERLAGGFTVATDDIEQRIARTTKAFTQALEDWHKQTLAEAEISPLRDQKFALLAALSALQIEGVDVQEASTVAATLTRLKTDWANSAKLSDEDESLLQERFTKQCSQIELWLSEQQCYAQWCAATDSVLQQLSDTTKNMFSERELNEFARRWQSLAADTPRMDPQREQQFVTALAMRREQEQQRDVGRQTLLEQFKVLVADVESALADGRVKDAAALARRTQQWLTSSAEVDRQYLHKHAISRRWRKAFAQVKELLDWRGWANTPVKEQLCQEMEALSAELVSREQDASVDAQSMINQVKALQARWVKLGASEPEAEGPLRERFQAAGDTAYEICRKHFAKLAQQRNVNFAAKQMLCQRLEEYLVTALIGTEPPTIDERAATQVVDAAQREWRDIGVIDRDQHAAVSERFKQAAAAIKTSIQQQRVRKRDQKQDLVARAEQLAAAASVAEIDAITLRALTDQAKSLQLEWKSVGSAAQEKELWQRFRGASDKVFQQRKQHQDDAKRERDANLSAKIALCEQVEQLAQLRGDVLRQARAQMETVKTQWETIGPIPKQDINIVLQRFRQALTMFEDQDRARIGALEYAKEAAITLKVQLCMEMEALADEVISKGIDREHATAKLSVAQTAWERIQSLDAHAEDAMRERFQNATDLILAADAWGDAVLDRFNNDKTTNLQKREELCLQLEILAEVESPEHAKQARMQYQVAQLARKMSQGGVYDNDWDAKLENARNIERQWYFTGPIPTDQASSLELRFSQAWVALKGKGEGQV